MKPPESEFVIHPKIMPGYNVAPDNWYELVFTTKGKWPTATLKVMWPSPGGPRCSSSERYRRWPDGKWYENDPYIPDPRYPINKKKAEAKGKFHGHCCSQEQIEAAYAIWLARRMLSEERGDSGGASAAPGADAEGRGNVADP